MEQPAYELIAVQEEDRVVGFLSAWNLPRFCYLEHFAFSPECRGGGFGTRTLKEYLTGKTSPVILEIDPLVDEISRRRCGFYERLGFVLTDHEHYQPPFRRGDSPVLLRIMSYGRGITDAEYDEFNKEYLQGAMSFSLA